LRDRAPLGDVAHDRNDAFRTVALHARPYDLDRHVTAIAMHQMCLEAVRPFDGEAVEHGLALACGYEIDDVPELRELIRRVTGDVAHRVADEDEPVTVADEYRVTDLLLREQERGDEVGTHRLERRELVEGARHEDQGDPVQTELEREQRRIDDESEDLLAQQRG